MRHALIKRVSALTAEEVSIVIVFAPQGRDVLTDDGSLAVLAARREGFVPVEVAVEPQSFITVGGFAFGYILARFTSFDTCEPGGSGERGFGAYFEVGEGGGADVALHAGGVPTFF